MTPQERELVADLFTRLAELERNPRDPDAERVMREGLTRAPNALYPLVQTVLLQDEALRVANDRIAELEDAVDRTAGAGRRDEPRGFLDSMRDTFLGGGEPQRGSVPRTGQPMGAPAGYGRDDGGRDAWGGQSDRRTGFGQAGGMTGGAPMQGGPMGGAPMGGGAMAAGGGGGSFLGTAAAAAAGAIGGGLLMSSIRGMMGDQSAQAAGSPFSGAFDKLAGKEPGAGGGELAKDAGLNDIGQSGRQGIAGQSKDEAQGEQYASAETEDDDDGEYDDDDFEEDNNTA